MSAFPASFRRRFRMVVACVLVIVGLFGVAHAVRAAIAQRLYLETKYGFAGGPIAPVEKTTDAAEVARRAHAADRLYPHNYYFPSYAARCALAEAVVAHTSEQFRDALAGALYFATLGGDVSRIGTPRATAAGGDSAASSINPFGQGNESSTTGTVGTNAPLTLLGWRQIY